LRLHPEELLEQDPMGLDPQKGFRNAQRQQCGRYRWD
jgi:hypothetical protein